MAKREKQKVEKKRRGATLTPKQELFCHLYTTDIECFGNRTQSYVVAYHVDISDRKKYDAARKEASRLVTKPHIRKFISDLLEQEVDEKVVDIELGKLIRQWINIPGKIAAIREYNEIKGRHAPKKLMWEDPLVDFDDSELMEEIVRRIETGEIKTKLLKRV